MILNPEKGQDDDSNLSLYVRDGILVVLKNASVPDETVVGEN